MTGNRLTLRDLYDDLAYVTDGGEVHEMGRAARRLARAATAVETAGDAMDGLRPPIVHSDPLMRRVWEQTAAAIRERRSATIPLGDGDELSIGCAGDPDDWSTDVAFGEAE